MRQPYRALVVPVVMLLLAGRYAPGGIVDPESVPSLGAFPTAPGAYVLDTSQQMLTGPGVNLRGTFVGGGIAFDFDSIALAPGAGIQFVGNFPIILLSRTDITLGSSFVANLELTRSGSVPQPYSGNEWLGGFLGGSGGGAGAGYGQNGFGTGAGRPSFSLRGAGGAGFGGTGGTGGVGGGDNLGVGAGGPSYGNLLSQIQGGSGGGGSGGSIVGQGGYGGNGGGAIELVAEKTLTFGGQILADGGAGNPVVPGGAGGGSGGGIILAGSTVVLSHAVLSARGGDGAPGGPDPIGPTGGGGGGAGGRILIASGSGGLDIQSLSIDVSGGKGGLPGTQQAPGFPDAFSAAGADGAPGVITFMVITPEPSSGALLVLGAIGLWLGRRRRFACGRVADPGHH